MPKTKPQYRALVGISYPPNRWAEPGDVVDDLPGGDIKRLIEQGAIEAVGKPAADDQDEE